MTVDRAGDAVGERTGVLFALRDDLDLVRTAERLGYESVWAAEGQGMTAFGKLERWSAVTNRVELATGIVNVYSRTPAAVAQAVATLDIHSSGRAILGLGVAHSGVVETFHGVPFDRPLARFREYLTLVRRYLAGDVSGFDGEFYSPDRTAFWEAFEPERAAIPIYSAALGQQNVTMTGAIADGWLPNLYPRERFETAQSWLADGASRADREVADIDVAMYMLVAVADDPAVARRQAASHVAYYLRDIPGYYARVAVDAGFDDVVERVRAAESTDVAVDAVDDAFLDSVAITGTPRDVRSGLQDWRDAGVDLPIVRAPAGASRTDVERLLETVAPESAAIEERN